MEKKKICVVCGKEFTPAYGQRKTCSDECRKARQKQKMEEWKKKNPDYSLQYYQENREHIIEIANRSRKRK